MEVAYLWGVGLGVVAVIVLIVVCLYKLASWIDEQFDYKEGEEWKDEDK